MEVGNGMLRKKRSANVEDTELRCSKRRMKLDGYPHVDDDDDHSVVNYSQLPLINSVVVCSENSVASDCSSELKHGELRSNEIKVSKRTETENSVREISKLLFGDNSFSECKKMKQQMESSTMTKKSNSTSSPSAKMPPMEEIESFFSSIEKYEQKRFSDKYNFDVAKDVPMEGRYEWVQIKP